MGGYRARMTGAGVVARQSKSPQVGPGSLGEILTQMGQLGAGLAKQDHQLQEQQLDVAHEAEIAMLQRKRSATIAQKMGEMAELEGSIDQELDSQRNYVDPAEWDKKADEIVRARWTKFADTLGDDPEVRERFEPAIARQRESTISREEDLSRIERAKAGAQGFETWATAAKGKLSRADKPDEVYQNYIADLVTYASGLDLPRTAVQQLIEAEASDGALQMFDRLVVQQRFDEAEKLVNAPEFDALLGGDPRDRILNGINNERRAAAALAEAEASAARTEVRKEIDGVLAGIPFGKNPTPEQLRALRGKAAAVGLDPKELVELDGLGQQMVLNRHFNEEFDPTGAKAAAYVAELKPKIANGTATAAEQIAFKHLGGVVEERRKATGAGMKDLAGQGVPGQMQVLGQLNGASKDEKFTTGQSAGKNLGYVAMVPKQSQEAVLKGMEDMAVPGQKILDTKKALGAFSARTKVAGIGLDETDLQGYMQVANGYYAYYAKQQGLSSDQFSPQIYESAVRVAFGGDRRADADGNLKWHGGIGMVSKTAVLLPDHLTDSGFEKILYRQPYNDAYVSGGVKTSKADVLANFAPVWVGNEGEADLYFYRHKVSGRWLKLKDGVTNYPLVVPPRAK